MDDPEIALALLEIVAVLLPLAMIALGLVPRWMEFDGPEILGVVRTVAFGSMAGLSLIFLAFSGIFLSLYVYGQVDSIAIKGGVGLIMLVFGLLGVTGFGVAIAFEEKDVSPDTESEEIREAE